MVEGTPIEKLATVSRCAIVMCGTRRYCLVLPGDYSLNYLNRRALVFTICMTPSCCLAQRLDFYHQNPFTRLG